MSFAGQCSKLTIRTEGDRPSRQVGEEEGPVLFFRRWSGWFGRGRRPVMFRGGGGSPCQVGLVGVAQFGGDSGPPAPLTSGIVGFASRLGSLDDSPSPNDKRWTHPDVIVEQPLKRSDADAGEGGEVFDSTHGPVIFGDRCQLGDLASFGDEGGLSTGHHLVQLAPDTVNSPVVGGFGANTSNEPPAVEAGEGAVEAQLGVDHGSGRCIEEDAESSNRCSRRDGPPGRGQPAVAHLGHHAVDAPFSGIERHSSIVGGADTDVARRMVEHLLVVDTIVGKLPGNRPEPLDQPVESITGGRTSEVDIPHHLHRIDDPASVVRDRPRHSRHTTSRTGDVNVQDPARRSHLLVERVPLLGSRGVCPRRRHTGERDRAQRSRDDTRSHRR